ncbi:MAG TPA: DUF4380 domain-containing protein [Terriglobales bacterium]|nr:DUF4380 domain-containing protein [Terriglobales bacterium]
MQNRKISLVLVLFLVVCVPSFAADKTAHRQGISSITYHGWADSLLLNNGKAEVVIVPAIGRVMQFNFAGEDGVLWENGKLEGKPADSTSKEWINFGGDKSWPSPQADWPKMIGRGWPPPATFDSTPLTARTKDSVVELVSPVDPTYGIRVHRYIKLDSHRPILTITTTYEKVSGDPVKVGIAVITQLRDPQRAFIKLPAQTKYPDGYALLNFEKPQDAKFQDGLFSLTRSHQKSSQIGNDGSSLLWMNEKYALRIDSPHVDGAEYAENSSAVIYTNADPDGYVELETYGPLTMMKAGDKIERTNVYTLSKRSETDPDVEAKKILGR